VIIPVKNRVNTIYDAIKSALKQRTNFRFNIIIVDNHSTDGTTEEISRIFKNNNKVIHIIPNRDDLEIGGCWNEAISHKECGKFAVQPGEVRGVRSDYRGSVNIIELKQKDSKGRTLRLAPAAAGAWQQMIDAGMPVNPNDITSVYRDENDYLRLKKEGYNPASNSYHNYGEAVDAHGEVGKWLRKNGPKFGWFPHDYNGSHGGHYEFLGVE